MNEIVTIEREPSAIASTEDFVTKLALNEKIDEQKLRVLWEIQKDVLAERRKEQAEAARIAYYAAMANAQKEFRIVDRDATNSQTHSQYARFETIWEACCPIWTAHGFSVSFPSSTTAEGNIRMVARIRHSAGHTEDITAPDAPPDGAGLRGTSNKTPIQANQSTVSYLKKGLLCSGFGIVTRLEDNDGNSEKIEKREVRQNSGGMRDYVESNELNRPKTQPSQAQRELQATLERSKTQTSQSETWISGVERKINEAPDNPSKIDQIGKSALETKTEDDIREMARSPVIRKLAEQPDNLTRIQAFFAAAKVRISKPAKTQEFWGEVEDPETEDLLGGPFDNETEFANCLVGEWEKRKGEPATKFLKHHAKTIDLARRNPEAKRILVRTLHAA